MLRRWTDVSPYPYSAEAIEARRASLRAAVRPPVKDRVEHLRSLAAGKRVLDVGCVDHVASQHEVEPSFLHRQVSGAAAYCLGVDIVDEGVEALRRAGFNVRRLDITRETPDERFDVMIVGEVIEHLGDPAALFRAAKKVLTAQGRLVLTTPNPYYLSRVWNNLFADGADSVDHVTLLFPSGIAELAEREGLALDQYRGILVPDEQLAGVKGASYRAFRAALQGLGLRPESGCDSLIYECVVAGG